MSDAILIYGSTEAGTAQFSADVLWRTKFRVPDPIIYIEHDGTGTLIASSLEYNRAKQESSCEVLLIDDLVGNGESRNVVQATATLLKNKGVTTLNIPATLPYSLGKTLAESFELKPISGSLFPARAQKTQHEVDEIERAGRAVGQAIEQARMVLRESTIDNDTIIHRGTALTSESLRAIIEQTMYAAGYLGVNSIVSCGSDAANPHAIGSGPLRPHQPIVCDIFPHSMQTNYHADITRTLFKGDPSAEMRHMYEAVRNAHAAGIVGVRAGVDGATLQKSAEESFANAGYATTVSGGVAEGFIHSLGHGVGLEVHELPHVGGVSHILEAGNVITIEPGLYYQHPKGAIPAGGIRLEDMVLVEEAQGRVLAGLPTDLAWAVIP